MRWLRLWRQHCSWLHHGRRRQLLLDPVPLQPWLLRQRRPWRSRQRQRAAGATTSTSTRAQTMPKERHCSTSERTPPLSRPRASNLLRSLCRGSAADNRRPADILRHATTWRWALPSRTELIAWRDSKSLPATATCGGEPNSARLPEQQIVAFDEAENSLTSSGASASSAMGRSVSRLTVARSWVKISTPMPLPVGCTST